MARPVHVRARRLRPYLSALATVAAVGLISPASEGSSPASRSRHDQVVLKLLEHRYPGATQEIERGEAMLRQAQLAKAAAHFADLAKRYPEGGLTARRQCQALVRLGQRREAIEACQESLGRVVSTESMRWLAAALVMAPPSTSELNQAVRMAEKAEEREPEEPWGYAAKFDIAQRLGDYAMQKKSLDQLERFAPRHPETVRARELFAEPRVPRTVVAGWLALATAVLATLVHAAWSLVRRARGAATAAASVLLLTLGAGQARAEDVPTNAREVPQHKDGVPAGGLSSFKVNREDPSAALPSIAARNADPLNFGYFLMDLSDLAFEAAQKGNYAQAAKYWEATARAVPEAALGFRNACENWGKAGDTAKALQFCRAALGTPGVKLGDHEALARLILGKTDALNSEEVTDITEMVKHLRTQPDGAKVADQMQCDLGTKLEDPRLLKECTDALIKSAPDDAKTISYQWALAVAKGDLVDARTQMERAKRAGVRPEGLKTMEEGMARASSIGMRWKRNQRLLTGAGAAVGLLALGGALVFMRRRKAPSNASPIAPTSPSVHTPAT